jgi:hypothetical protein
VRRQGDRLQGTFGVVLEGHAQVRAVGTLRLGLADADVAHAAPTRVADDGATAGSFRELAQGNLVCKLHVGAWALR